MEGISKNEIETLENYITDKKQEKKEQKEILQVMYVWFIIQKNNVHIFARFAVLYLVKNVIYNNANKSINQDVFYVIKTLLKIKMI